jgi:hypothetical protein
MVNTDEAYNSCKKAEQSWDEEEDYVFSGYTEGSLVWAKMLGYPWYSLRILTHLSIKSSVLSL